MFSEFSDANCFCLVDGEVYYQNNSTTYANRLINGLRLDYVCELNVWNPKVISMITGIPPTNVPTVPDSVKEREYIPMDDEYDNFENYATIKKKPYTNRVLKSTMKPGQKKAKNLRHQGNTYKMFIENDFVGTVMSEDPLAEVTSAPTMNLRGSIPNHDATDDYGQTFAEYVLNDDYYYYNNDNSY